MIKGNLSDRQNKIEKWSSEKTSRHKNLLGYFNISYIYSRWTALCFNKPSLVSLDFTDIRIVIWALLISPFTISVCLDTILIASIVIRFSRVPVSYCKSSCIVAIPTPLSIKLMCTQPDLSAKSSWNINKEADIIHNISSSNNYCIHRWAL